MSDCMTFPDTVEEFMEQQKVVDTDCVYSNGIEFVPIFRMKQWFATQPENIRCRDCRKYRKFDCPMGITVFDAPDPDGYCYKAERKTDG